MGRGLVIISNFALKKKIITLISGTKGLDLFFISDTDNFIEEYQLIEPDLIIVDDDTLMNLCKNDASLAIINSVRNFFLAVQDAPVGPFVYPCRQPVVIHNDFDFSRLLQPVSNNNSFNLSSLNHKPFKWILDYLPIGLFWKDLELKYLGCNKIFADDQGISDPARLVGLSDYDIFPAECADLYVQRDRELIARNSTSFCYEETGVDRDGAPEVIWKRKILIRDEKGDACGILGMYEKKTKEKQRETELQDERRMMQMLMDNIPDTIYFKDLESRFTRINKAQARMLGIKHTEEAVGKTDADFFDPEFAIIAQNDEQAMMKSGVPVINKLETIHTPEGPRHVMATKIPLKDDHGAIIGMVGVSRDITQKHTLEIKLQQETNLLNTLMDNVPETIYFKDLDSKFTRINKAWLSKHHLTDEQDVIGKTDADFFEADFAGKTLQAEQSLMQEGIPLLNMLESHKNPMGNQVYTLANKVPLFDQHNKVVGMIGISHDITGLKIAESKLTHEKELLQALMDFVPDTIYFKDIRSRFTRVNRAFAMAVGLRSPEEVIGKCDADFFPDEQVKNSRIDEEYILKSGKPKINRIEKVKNANGKILWLSTTKIPIKDQEGIITGFIGISRDVTVLEEARSNLIYAKEKAEEANRAKSLFLANMSHEIRTPMNGVIGMADVLYQTVLTDEQRDYLGIITKSGNNLLSIINNILDFSKIESGSLELEKAPVNIRQVIENVADILIITASNKNVNLINYVDSTIPEIVEGDALRLHQVLLNLVNNALKFTTNGEVFFTAELIDSGRTAYTVLFKVKDSGIGISKEAQQKIFRSFTQADSSTTRKFGGTGLGLAISKRLVGMMGGEIGVESAEGEGSTFWFSAQFGPASHQEDPRQTPAILIEGLKVLIIDDNRTNRFVFGKYLDTWQCRYEQADNGITALNMLIHSAEQNNPFDMALVDYQMEGMDGLKLAEQIRSNPLISNTRLILLSSVTDVIPRSEVRSHGFNCFLNKPVKLNELYGVISSATGNADQGLNKPVIIPARISSNLRVLVAEDNFTNLKVAQLILKPFTTLFDSAENGLIAFEKFRSNRYDVIFMDIQMPVMSGYEATKKIREYELENHLTPVKIVAMTAAALKEDIEKCLSCGMDNYLSKPFKREDMIRIIKNLNL